MGHIHAASMAEYAKDAMDTDKPWERWEFSNNEMDYVSLHKHPNWYADVKYRRKAKTILINGHEVPEPHRIPLGIGEVYWAPTLFVGAVGHFWQDNDVDNSYIKNGFIHLTKEAAEKHFNALKSFTALKE